MISLRALIGFQNIKMYIIKDISAYYSSDFTREVLTFQNYHNYSIECFYIACFLASTLLIFMRDSKIKEEKIQFLNKNDCFKLFIVIFTLIFTKDIENAI